MTAKKATAAAPAASPAKKRNRKPVLKSVPAGYEEAAAAKLVPPVEVEVIRSLADIDKPVSKLEAEKAALESRLADAIAAAEIFDRLFKEEKAGRETDVEALKGEVVSLTGQLRDEKSARARDLETQRRELNEADRKLHELEASTERSLRTVRRQRDEAIDERNAARRRYADMQARIHGLETGIAAGNEKIIELGADLDTAEERIGHLEKELENARRGWISRLFRRA